MNEEVKRCKICNKRLVGNRRMFCASCQLVELINPNYKVLFTNSF